MKFSNFKKGSKDMHRNVIMAIMAVFPAALTGCMEDSLPAVEILVRDESGLPVDGARVMLHAGRLDWADYQNVLAEGTTDAGGRVALEVVQSGRYFVNVSSGERNNRFGRNRTERRLEPGEIAIEEFSVRPPSDRERILSGGDHLVWKLAPLMTPQGEPFLDYPVDTDMYIDGRWLDSNGRLGLWWFNDGETKIYYDYATSGAVVESRMVSLTEDLFRAEIDFFGIRMLIEMYPS